MRTHPLKSAAAVHLREHASLYVFVIVLFLMGVIFGAIVVNSLSFSQKQDLYYYLTQFLDKYRKTIWRALTTCSAKAICITSNTSP